MKDYEAFNEALQRDTTYAATLSRSLSLVPPPPPPPLSALLNTASMTATSGTCRTETVRSLCSGTRSSSADLLTHLNLIALVQVLEEFYENLKNVGVSAATGEGMEAFFNQVQACAEEYRQLYLPELQRRQQVRVTLRLCQDSSCKPVATPWK